MFSPEIKKGTLSSSSQNSIVFKWGKSRSGRFSRTYPRYHSQLVKNRELESIPPDSTPPQAHSITLQLSYSFQININQLVCKVFVETLSIFIEFHISEKLHQNLCQKDAVFFFNEINFFNGKRESGLGYIS